MSTLQLVLHGFAVTVFVAMLCVATPAFAQPLAVPNPSFETGDVMPDTWQLVLGDGEWIEAAADGKRAIAVTGNGSDSLANFWISEGIDFKPEKSYQLQFQARFVEGAGGSLFSGPMFNNRDLPELTGAWQLFTTNFITPTRIREEDSRLRFGQWDINGTVAFDAVKLFETVPVYRRWGDIVLGAGERIADTEYTFTAPLHDDSMNHARTLHSFDCYFNKPRWVFAKDNWVIYQHRVGDLEQLAANLELYIGYYTGGAVEIEAGPDGQNWTSLGMADSRGTFTFSLPDHLFPAKDIWVRLRTKTQTEPGQIADIGGSVQVYGYQYNATLAQSKGNYTGATQFLVVSDADQQIDVTITDLGACLPGINSIQFELTNKTNLPLSITPRITTTTDSRYHTETDAASILLDAKTTQSFTVEYEIADIGKVNLTFELREAVLYRAETTFYISPLYAQNYGTLLPGTTDDVAVWWASSGWKVSQSRAVPDATSSAVRIQAARNESEAAQVVLRPSIPVNAVRIKTNPLSNEAGDRIPESAIDVFQVGFVPIAIPTDSLGATAPWPDPLLPIDQEINLRANENQPFWIRVSIPNDIQAGVYAGTIQFEAEGWETEVPLEIEVFDFTLPDRMTCQTAFGFDGSLVLRYHGVETEEDRQTLARNYMDVLSAHHISPYELGPKLLYPDLEYTWPYLPKWRGGERVRIDDATGGGALFLEDTSRSAAVSAGYEEKIDIPEEGLHITFRHKTQIGDHPFILVLMHYDQNNQWLSGRNTVLEITSKVEWQTYETIVTDFPDTAKQFMFELQPTLYVEDGSTTGLVWIDSINISNAGTNVVLFEDTFNSYTEAELEQIFRPEFDWESWDDKMNHILDTYHFNSFVLRTPGLGFGAGWAQHDNIPGNLLGYTEDTPEYQAAFHAWYYTVQEHLREKGWLEKAFIYWFDEPEPKDYDFVMKGNQQIKQAAPDLQRKLTEEVMPELIGGPNLWCPISYEYDHEEANARRVEGERFWWYICTAPKAPYATLFIDHPATELRVWLWQTWQRDIEGILIWHTHWWTSDAAYPDSLQNPYEDPMSWCHILGDLIPAGAKHPWGNGDGRFLYPPLAAADGNPEQPVLEPPIGSIRLDMLRDGIEDYEYLAILQELINKHQESMETVALDRYRALLEVPSDITSSLNEFTWDPETIEERREAIAHAIVELSRGD